MRRQIAIAVALIFGLTAPWGMAQAAVPVKKYSTCKEVWKKYPTGIAVNKVDADRAVASGCLRPRVNVHDYWRVDKSIAYLIVCLVAKPDTVPSAPLLGSPYVLGLTVSMTWTKPVDAGSKSVFDAYLNGVKVAEGLTTITEGGTISSYRWDNLAAATTYTLGVTTRNPAGTSPMATATATTVSQEEADHPGLVKVIYTGTGTVDLTMESSTGGTQQFSDVTNPTYTFWFRPGEFVYFSVQNQNPSGDVSCSITSNGRTVANNTSSGAYVIAGCSGRA